MLFLHVYRRVFTTANVFLGTVPQSRVLRHSNTFPITGPEVSTHQKPDANSVIICRAACLWAIESNGRKPRGRTNFSTLFAISNNRTIPCGMLLNVCRRKTNGTTFPSTWHFKQSRSCRLEKYGSIPGYASKPGRKDLPKRPRPKDRHYNWLVSAQYYFIRWKVEDWNQRAFSKKTAWQRRLFRFICREEHVTQGSSDSGLKCYIIMATIQQEANQLPIKWQEFNAFLHRRTPSSYTTSCHMANEHKRWSN